MMYSPCYEDQKLAQSTILPTDDHCFDYITKLKETNAADGQSYHV